MEFFVEVSVASILIVEDDFFWVSMIQDALKDNAVRMHRTVEDLHFDIVDKAENALSRIEHKAYDLIITDMLFARFTGDDLIKEIRKTKSLIELPILVLTAVDGVEIKYPFVRKGATDVFAKPLKEDELQRFINVVFNLISGR